MSTEIEIFIPNTKVMCVHFFIDFYESKLSKGDVAKVIEPMTNFEEMLPLSFRLSFMKQHFNDVRKFEIYFQLQQEKNKMKVTSLHQPENRSKLILLSSEKRARSVS